MIAETTECGVSFRAPCFGAWEGFCRVVVSSMDGIIEVSGEANVALIAEVYFAAGRGVRRVLKGVVSL